MRSQIKSLETFEMADPKDLPDGEYVGTWGGYVVEFIAGGKFYRAGTVGGIRTPAATCLVKVEGDQITLDTNLRKAQGGEDAERNIK